MDFFIINDAIVQKICILGDDVEPCFEGASVTAPNVSSKFTLDDNFRHTLFSMMQDLRDALNEGGQQMKDLENTVVVDEAAIEYTAEEVEEVTETVDNTEFVEDTTEDTSVPAENYEVEENGDAVDEIIEPVSEFTEIESVEDSNDTAAHDYELLSEKYQTLEQEVNDWKEKYSALETKYQELVSFKNEIDNQKKDALIAEFYMLSDSDKEDVIQNKEKYTLDEIKAKLSVICFDKKINFTLDNENKDSVEEVTMTYALNDNNSNLPDWVKAVKEQERLG